MRTPAFLLVLLPLTVSSCTPKETYFPPYPPEHRLVTDIQAWPDDYYWNVASGVSGRVLGIRAEGDTDQQALTRVDALMDSVVDGWTEIDPLTTSQDIVDYLREKELNPVADAVDEALADNAAGEPADGVTTELQAEAVKIGLGHARYWVDEELGRIGS